MDSSSFCLNKASPLNVFRYFSQLNITYGVLRSFCPREFRPRENFSSTKSELKNPNRAGEILRDGKNLDERLQGANRKTPVK